MKGDHRSDRCRKDDGRLDESHSTQEEVTMKRLPVLAAALAIGLGIFFSRL
jgi:hypothetical protein